MKKGLKILVGILVVFVIIGVIAFGVMYIHEKEVLNTEVTKNTSLEVKNQNIDNMVKITDGKIENEDLIDEFINEVTKEKVGTLKIIVKDNNSEENLEIDFVPSEIDGYYKFSINGEEKARYNKLSWSIDRMTKENKVILYFNTYAKLREIPIICEYDLDSSNYKEKFELNYGQRKDLGIKTIIDKNLSDKYDYNVCTFGGEVTITIEKDMVYTLEDAIQQNVITVEDILSQAKMDEKYGICQDEYYSDGGSTEYCYPEYTILKYNTLDGNQDLYIGMKGQIINQLNEILDDE